MDDATDRLDLDAIRAQVVATARSELGLVRMPKEQVLALLAEVVRLEAERDILALKVKELQHELDSIGPWQ